MRKQMAGAEVHPNLCVVPVIAPDRCRAPHHRRHCAASPIWSRSRGAASACSGGCATAGSSLLHGLLHGLLHCLTQGLLLFTAVPVPLWYICCCGLCCSPSRACSLLMPCWRPWPITIITGHLPLPDAATWLAAASQSPPPSSDRRPPLCWAGGSCWPLPPQAAARPWPSCCHLSCWCAS